MRPSPALFRRNRKARKAYFFALRFLFSFLWPSSGGAGRGFGSTGATGSTTVKVSPVPSLPDAQMKPWCALTTDCAIAMPRPVPPFCLARDGSAV